MSIAEIVLLFTGILAVYTIGLVLSRKYQPVNAVIVIGLGLVADYYGTWQMYSLSNNFNWGMHSILGIGAIILMTVSALTGLIGISTHSHAFTKIFRNTLPWTYGLWVTSYLNGFISYGA